MRKSLIVVLLISALIEIYLSLGVLFKPESMMQSFGITSINGEILYMAAIVGWFCLLATALAVVSAWWVYHSRREGLVIAFVLGLFWLGIGFHLGFSFARPQHFVLDAAKGLLISVLAFVQLRKQNR